MTQCISLLRGINSGRAKRVAMADLRALVEGLGFSNVRTILNTGNVIFEAARPNATKIASVFEAAIQKKFGFPVPVIVITASDLDSIVAGNPLSRAVKDPSKFLVAFVSKATVLGKAKSLLKGSWAPEALAIGDKSAYLWCAEGILESKLVPAFSRVTENAVTTRNWSTVLKLQAACADSK